MQALLLKVVNDLVQTTYCMSRGAAKPLNCSKNAGQSLVNWDTHQSVLGKKELILSCMPMCSAQNEQVRPDVISLHFRELIWRLSKLAFNGRFLLFIIKNYHCCSFSLILRTNIAPIMARHWKVVGPVCTNAYSVRKTFSNQIVYAPPIKRRPIFINVTILCRRFVVSW